MGALYEPAALTAELWALAERIVSQVSQIGKSHARKFFALSILSHRGRTLFIMNA
jgi:hypothetical protein